MRSSPSTPLTGKSRRTTTTFSLSKQGRVITSSPTSTIFRANWSKSLTTVRMSLQLHSPAASFLPPVQAYIEARFHTDE